MNVFDYVDYRGFIRELIAKNSDGRGYQSRLAREAGCQRSYLSSILNGTAHFSLEQGLKLAVFFEFDDTEIDYFLELIGLARAGTEELRQHSLRRAKTLKSRALSAATRLGRPVLNPHDVQRYYSSWHWSAIHMLLTIPTIQTAEQIVRALDIAPRLVELVLAGLHEMGIIEKKGEQWIILVDNVHLSKDSPLVRVHHNNWRLKAAQFNEYRSDYFQFTSAVSMSRTDFEAVQVILLKAIEQVAKVIEGSSSEEVFCINLDFLPLQKSESERFRLV